MTKNDLQDKELEILRNAVDVAEKKTNHKVVNSPEVKQIISIVENFLRTKQLVCYGGTAINNILPVEDQFYDKSLEIPDYDFFSMNALNDAKELANIYHKEGYTDVEAKAGVHHGTFKVYVNYIPVADITMLHNDLFRSVKRESIKRAGILYAPPNYLRMAMYLELSRPKGDVSRWEKVLKRLILLNKHYPLKGKNCNLVDTQRSFESKKQNEETIYDLVKRALMDEGAVFFGGYANSLYSNHMPRYLREKHKKIPDFDVLVEDPQKVATIVKERLGYDNVKNVSIKKHNPIGELVDEHYSVIVAGETVAFLYKPNACHSYNVLHTKHSKIKIATIDTMLSMYLAFLYSSRDYFQPDRILCMAQYLFTVQQKNRLEQKGLLRRFSLSCYGKQDTLESMRALKTEKFEELKNKRGTDAYDEWFLKYSPGVDGVKKQANKKTKKNTKKKRKTKKKKQVKGGKKTHRKKKYIKGGNTDADPSQIAEYIRRSATWAGENKKPNEDKAISIISGNDFDPNQESKEGIPLIHVAMNSRNMKILEMLIKHPKTDTEAKTINDETVLQKAISSNNDYVINLFKKNGKIPQSFKKLL